MLVFQDNPQKLIRGAMDNIQLKKRQHLIELIQKHLFKSLVSFEEVSKILPLFSKKKYLMKQSLFKQGEPLEEVFVMKQGNISLSVDYQQPELKKPQSLLRRRPRRSTADLSIVSDRNILGEDLLFMDTI